MFGTLNAQDTLAQYAEAYRRLYRRVPPELGLVDPEWATVNGVRMRVSEIERLTQQILSEYSRVADERRRTVERIVDWLEQ